MHTFYAVKKGKTIKATSKNNQVSFEFPEHTYCRISQINAEHGLLLIEQAFVDAPNSIEMSET